MRKDVDTQHIVVLYTQNHLTCRQISAIVGISHTAVMDRLKKAGVDSSQGERVMVPCATCGKLYSLTRCRWKVEGRKFCSNACYWATRGGETYKEWRHGTRIARAVVALRFRMLAKGEVVHHIDGDQRNNKPENLMVFSSQADHMRHHHGQRAVLPLWSGA